MPTAVPGTEYFSTEYGRPCLVEIACSGVRHLPYLTPSSAPTSGGSNAIPATESSLPPTGVASKHPQYILHRPDIAHSKGAFVNVFA